MCWKGSSRRDFPHLLLRKQTAVSKEKQPLSSGEIQSDFAFSSAVINHWQTLVKSSDFFYSRPVSQWEVWSRFLKLRNHKYCAFVREAIKGWLHLENVLGFSCVQKVPPKKRFGFTPKENHQDCDKIFLTSLGVFFMGFFFRWGFIYLSKCLVFIYY